MSYRTICLIAFCLSVFLPANSTEHEKPDRCALYEAYLTERMEVWGEWLENDSAFLRCEEAEEAELVLEYEYGYTAYLIQFGTKERAAVGLQRFRQHIEQARSQLSIADYKAYLAAAEAYTLKAEGVRLSRIFRCRSYAREALETDPESPLAVMINANVMFYFPRIAGGKKQKALELYQKAQDVYRQSGDTICNWQYREAVVGEQQCRKY